jgi:hypothetical protein
MTYPQTYRIYCVGWADGYEWLIKDIKKSDNNLRKKGITPRISLDKVRKPTKKNLGRVFRHEIRIGFHQ